MAYYSGRVHSVIYENPSKAFYIVRMLLDGKNPSEADSRVIARGCVPGIALRMGTWFGFEADWANHKEHGKQLSITKAPVLSGGWDADTAEKVLASAGVGELTLKTIRLKLGDDTSFLSVLGDALALEAMPGVDKTTAKYIFEKWQASQAYFKVLDFLNNLGIPSGKVSEVWSTFGDDAESVLTQNPWALVKIEGINFQQADEVAVRLGLSLDSPNRVRGAVLYVLKDQRGCGHLFLTTGQLFAGVQGVLPDVSLAILAEVLAGCHKSGDLILDRTTRPGTTAVYEPWSYNIEKDSAAMLIQRQITAGFGPEGSDLPIYMKQLSAIGDKAAKEVSKKRPKLDKVARAAVEDWGQLENLSLSDLQKQGVINALTQPISILTGLPGSGKSTSLRAVVRILQHAQVKFLLCAPTGIAAKNLASRTGAPAHTIHRAFCAKGSGDERREFTYAGFTGGETTDAIVSAPDKDSEWGFGPENPYPAEIVIIDEFSMADQHLMYRLLSCTSPKCRMVFVGDAAQLPSVGPGNVLRDLIGSGRFPTISLTEIFRQKDTSAIVYAAHSIFRGDVPECNMGTDFTLVPVASEETALNIINTLAVKLYEKRENFQVLSPRHAGAVGVTNLNAQLRELINPQVSGLAELRMGEDTVRQDDRVMVVHNDYTLGIFNGDIGKVARIDKRAKSIEIKIFGEPPLHVQIPMKDASKLLRLAYCATIHKAQGMEYDIIVLPLMDSFRHQLQRNLLYTAVTRAKKRVFLVGTATALAKAVMNDQEDLRNTLFRDRLMIGVKSPDSKGVTGDKK